MEASTLSREILSCTKPNNGLAAKALGINFAIIITAIVVALLIDYALVQFFCVLIIGVKQFSFVDSFIHDLAHKQFFSSHKLNDFFGALIARSFGKSFDKYRKRHLQHHKNFDTNEDPTIKKYKMWGLMQKQSRRMLFYKIFIRPFTGYCTLYYIKHEMNWDYKSVILWTSLFSIFWYFNIQYFLLIYWILPYIYINAIIYYWSEIQDHWSETGTVSRNSLSLTDRFLHNGHQYHKLHHDKPYIPAYYLSRINALMNSH